MKEGRFREDLYYRINVIPIKLPPLRERTEDIPQLAEFFLRRYNARFRKRIQGITDPTMAMLKKYWWPGNIRELENLIERLVAVSDKDYISEEDLPLEFHFAQLEPQGRTDRESVRGRDQHVRAEFHPARAREVRLERHRHRRVPWNSAEYVEIQDGQARRSTARAAIARRVSAARKLASPAKLLDLSSQSAEFADGNSSHPSAVASIAAGNALSASQRSAGQPSPSRRERPSRFPVNSSSDRSGRSRAHSWNMRCSRAAAISSVVSQRKIRPRLQFGECNAAFDVQPPCAASEPATKCS